MACRFCELIRTDEKTWYKDQWISVFFDIDPIAKGHILIVPNQHFLDIDELPSAVLHRVFQCSQAYVKLLKEKMSPKGYAIMQNGGEFNDIGHFHLHVFPRFNCVLSTTGTFNAKVYHRATGQLLRDMPQRHHMSWFVEFPADAPSSKSPPLFQTEIE